MNDFFFSTTADRTVSATLNVQVAGVWEGVVEEAKVM